jgi:hypothetical protein
MFCRLVRIRSGSDSSEEMESDEASRACAEILVQLLCQILVLKKKKSRFPCGNELLLGSILYNSNITITIFLKNIEFP